MTWAALFARLKDPTIALAILLAVSGEVQAQSDWLLSWLGPTAAGRVLSAVGLTVAILRILQTLPPKVPPDTHDDGTAGESQ